MITIGEALDPVARRRLARLAQPEPDPDELAQTARDAAAESTGPGTSAWMAVAVAIATARSTAGAAIVLDEILEHGPLQTLAQACLATLCNDDTDTETQ